MLKNIFLCPEVVLSSAVCLCTNFKCFEAFRARDQSFKGSDALKKNMPALVGHQIHDRVLVEKFLDVRGGQKHSTTPNMKWRRLPDENLNQSHSVFSCQISTQHKMRGWSP